jgi:hypothetical protein
VRFGSHNPGLQSKLRRRSFWPVQSRRPLLDLGFHPACRLPPFCAKPGLIGGQAASTVLAPAENLPKIVDQSSVGDDVE